MWRYVLLAASLSSGLCGQVWQTLDSGTTADLRGVSAVSDRVAWASGTKATILRTIDGGEDWQSVGPEGVDNLDFRDIEAFSDRLAYAMSAGEGRLSRLYKTTDGGMSWTAIRINLIPDGFWNAIAFWDDQHGILMGDPVRGKFTILTTSDGGATWKEREGPKAEKNEAAFAASGTSLIARGARDAWFVTGGTGGGRIFHSDDGGDTWTVARSPLKPASETAGLYSIGFDTGGLQGIAVGGDYRNPTERSGNILVTGNGGKSWEAPGAGSPYGYRSVVAYIGSLSSWVVAGPTGMDVSGRGSIAFQKLSESLALNALSQDGRFAVGPKGLIVQR